eukprot:284191-Prymnesium_polylepis.2
MPQEPPAATALARSITCQPEKVSISRLPWLLRPPSVCPLVASRLDSARLHGESGPQLILVPRVSLLLRPQLAHAHGTHQIARGV